MRTLGLYTAPARRLILHAALAAAVAFQPLLAQDKPTGAPLILSTIETEQEVPLAFIQPDGKTALCAQIKLHWNYQSDLGLNDDATSFSIDLPEENPTSPIFTSQLWHASLASALAWQQPWRGARWKVLQTPVTEGSGIDAALAVGMIATSARRPYPPKTVVIGSLNPDGSLGPVSHLTERLNAAATAGMTRVIIPNVQRFDTDSTGQVVNMLRYAEQLHLECVPVDNLVAATETTMNDPLPELTLDAAVPKYSNGISSYIDTFASHEQSEATSGLKFAPKEAELAKYPPRQAAIWKSIYADVDAAQQAYRAGQVYVAYQLFCRANSRMNGANALGGQSRASFDVKSALAESDDLHDHLHVLMTPPSNDDGSLKSALLVAEMADWAYEINASLEGAQLITKQAFSQRSDATDAEKDRAREAILFANEECKYLLSQVNFYTGLLDHIAQDNASAVDENAAHLLPQLIPAQLATARSFTEGIRGSDLRTGLLFDPRLVAYVNVLRQIKAKWDSRERRKEIEAQAAPPPAPSTDSTNAAPNQPAEPVKLNVPAPTSTVAFDPGDTYRPPHTVVAPTAPVKKLSDVAQCLIWVNHDCEIATLNEKYLRLTGTMDATTHEWHIKDRAKLDELLQMAEIGARHGIAFAQKAELDPSVLAMIYERASHQRLQGDDASALDALRNYWRCALLGNVCWQLAFTRKAQPVDLSSEPPATNRDEEKNSKKDDKKTDTAAKETTKKEKAASTNQVVKVSPPGKATSTNVVVNPAITNTDTINPPVAPIATNMAAENPTPPTNANSAVAVDPPVAPIATNDLVTPTPPPAPPASEHRDVTDNPPVAPIATNANPTPAPPSVTASTNSVTSITPDEMNIPVAPIAKAEDLNGQDNAPKTNAVPTPSPTIGPIPPSKKPDNANGQAESFP